MARFWILDSVALCAMLFTFCVPVEAQQPTKVPKIGFLSAVPLSTMSARVEAFRQGLRELGYIEGQNPLMEYRFAEGKLDKVSHNAAEHVRLNVDEIDTD